MDFRFLLHVLVLLLIDCADAFLDEDTEVGQPGPASICILRSKGSSELTDIGYSTGGPVETANILGCNFRTPCCWKNADDATKQFMNFVGDPSTCLKQSTLKGGIYAMTQGTSKKKGFAALQSCTVVCAEGPITVKAKFWRHPKVKFAVCTKAAFSATSKLRNCKNLVNEQPVTLPGDEIFDIHLVASNFNEDTAAVIIENIEVNFLKCDRSNVCDKKASCSMGGQDPQAETVCGWSNTGNRKFVVYRKHLVVGNGDTGVNAQYVEKGRKAVYPEVSRGNFAALALNPGDSAQLTIDKLDIPDPVVMTLEFYSACEGSEIKICTDPGVCRTVSTKGTPKYPNRHWQELEYRIQKGTQKIDIVAVNGKYYCAAGIANIVFHRANPRIPLC